ncbi:MAG: NGG1p interacting factor NIF3 [Bacteriovoracales bacterium]
MFKIVVFIPKDNCEEVKEAMFLAGAGRFKNYDSCSFEIEGTGQFRPLKNSNPFLGKINSLERVTEMRVEMICSNECIKDVISAMKSAHPYEEVAFDVISLIEVN